MIEITCNLIDPIESFALLPSPLFLGRNVLIGDFDTDPLPQPTNGFREAQPFDTHEERKNVSPHSAAKAVENLPRRIDVEGWRFFMVKRTAPEMVHPGTLQLQIAGNDLDDIDSVANFLDFFFRYQRLNPTTVILSPPWATSPA